jgi:hypothetical protein
MGVITLMPCVVAALQRCGLMKIKKVMAAGLLAATAAIATAVPAQANSNDDWFVWALKKHGIRVVNTCRGNTREAKVTGEAHEKGNRHGAGRIRPDRSSHRGGTRAGEGRSEKP